MSGNFVKVGITIISYINECCGAVFGTAMPTACGWLLASATFQIIGTTSTDFDVCQDRISYPFPLRRRGLLDGFK